MGRAGARPELDAKLGAQAGAQLSRRAPSPGARSELGAEPGAQKK